GRIDQARGLARLAQHLRGRVVLYGRRRAGLHTRCAVCSAQTQLVHPPGRREEILLRQHPRRGELRVEDRLEVCAERAVAVGANRTRQEEPVAEGDLLLQERAERTALIRRLVRELDRARIDRDGAGREVASRGTVAVEDVLVVLIAEDRSALEFVLERARGRRRGV